MAKRKVVGNSSAIKTQKTPEFLAYQDSTGKKIKGTNFEGMGLSTNIGRGPTNSREANAEKIQARKQTKVNSMGMTFGSPIDKDMVVTCIEVYENVGIVRNIIDLISDFTSEGIDLIHQNKSVQNFWNAWLKRARISDRTERIPNTLLKAGTCVIQRRDGKITSKEEREMKKTGATAKKKEANATKNRTVPVGYTILDPRTFSISAVDQDGKPIIKKSKGKDGVTLGTDISGGNATLNSDPRNFICTYKKDDWEKWAKPYHYAALGDLAFENKLQRMDEAAADGVINAIRIWKLGGELKDGNVILPTPAVSAKLANVLLNDVGGGVADIIWDQFIQLQVEYPPVEKILGGAKYDNIRKKILEDFGIAQVLIDGSGQGSYSNQYLSVRSLIEKIEYLRGIIIEWLEGEIKIIAKNMGFKKLPKIVFKHIDLGNEEAKIALVMQLFDRNIISKNLMLDYIEQDWDIEKDRIKIENTQETDDDKMKKGGPFIPTDEKEEIPGKVGGNGRPANKPGDKTQKKKRVTKPQGASVYTDLLMTASRLQSDVDKEIDRVYLAKAGVKNIKQLSKAKKEELENIKFMLFAGLEDGEDIDLDNFVSAKEISEDSKNTCDIYKNLVSRFHSKYGEITADAKKQMKVTAWAIARFDIEEN